MLIIVEGPDGVGKTTFVAGLQAYMQKVRSTERTEIMRRGVPTQHPLDEYVVPLVEYKPTMKWHVITDRWHVGEWVYPAILQRKTQSDRTVWYYIEMFLQSRGALVVYLDDKDEHIAQRVRERGDDLTTPEMTPQISQAYRFMRDQHLTRAIRFNVERPATDEQYRWVVAHAEFLECDAAQVAQFTTFVGHPRATTLLVGDIRHDVTLDRPETYHRRPAFMPYRATSGHFMLKHLPTQMLRNSIALVNACDVDDVEKVITEVQPIQVVALGGNAAAAVAKYGFVTGFGAVPHPQYVRRFHHEHGEAYATVIQQAARAQKDMRAWRP